MQQWNERKRYKTAAVSEEEQSIWRDLQEDCKEDCKANSIRLAMGNEWLDIVEVSAPK
jgi:hypothetical protein